MERNGEGTKFKMLIHVDGLGTKYLSDNDVSVTAKFYTKHPMNVSYDAYEVEKEDMVAYEEGDCNDYYCLVDTTGLGFGLLIADIIVSYPDSDVGTITEKVRCETDIVLIKSE